MTRVLDVWWEGRIVGQLTQNRHGALGFAPERKYASEPAMSQAAPSAATRALRF